MHIAVVGAGLIGLPAASLLARTGHSVSLVDRGEPGSGTSSTSFAWTNSNNKDPDVYHRLNVAGSEAHARLQDALAPAEPWYIRTGSVMWHAGTDGAADRALAERAALMTERGYPVHLLTAEAVRTEAPHLRLPAGPETVALAFPSEGHLHVREYLAAVRDRFETDGGTVRTAEAATVGSSADGVHLAFRDGTVEAFDAVVVASGKHSGDLAVASGFDLPMVRASVPSPWTHSFLGYTGSGADLLDRVFVSDVLNLRPTSIGGLIVQAPVMEHLCANRDAADPAGRTHAEVRGHMDAWLDRLLPGAGHVERLVLAERSLPADGRPVLGPLDPHGRVLAAVTHSGATLSALFAEAIAGFLGAEEFADARELFAPFDPHRFAEGRAFTDGVVQEGLGKQ